MNDRKKLDDSVTDEIFGGSSIEQPIVDEAAMKMFAPDEEPKGVFRLGSGHVLSSNLFMKKVYAIIKAKM